MIKRIFFLSIFCISLFAFVQPATAALGDYVDRWSTGFVSNGVSGAYSLFWDGSNIWIIQRGNNTLHKFTADGTEDVAATITFTPENAQAQGIAWNGTSFWIVDSEDKLVYEYNANGDYQSTFDISGEVSAEVRGIVWDGTYFWISDFGNDEVYRYDANGEYTNYSWDTAASGNGGPIDLTWDGTYFWVVDYQDLQIYQYSATGTYQSKWSVNVNNIGLRGITMNGDYFFVSDLSDGYVYRYERSADGTAPTITSVTSDKADGTYGVGSVIDIDLTFSEPVNATTTVTVTLETGDTDRTCTLTISNAQSASCNYTVQEGDTSADLDVLSISGTIVDLSGNAMSNFTPSTTLATNKALVIETIAPTVFSLSPADDVTAVAIDSSLVVTFSENIVTSTGNIVIYQASDDSIVETIDVAGDKVTVSGDTLTINPGSDLSGSTEYYVQIAATAIDDSAGNSFAGITDATTWSFTTADVTNPTVLSFIPTDNATDVSVGSNLVITFSENIVAGSGNIVIYKASDDSMVETIAVGSATISDDTLTINPGSDFSHETAYYVQIATTAIDDSSGNSFAGITDATTWSFTTVAAPSSGGGGHIPAIPPYIAIDSNIKMSDMDTDGARTSPAFVIHNDASETNSRNVLLTFLDIENVSMFALSESANFERSSFQTYTTQESFVLSEGEGKKTVYAKLLSPQGATLVLKDSIILKTTEDTTDTYLDPNQNLQCSSNVYLTNAVKLGGNNNPQDVRLLEEFLNTYENAHLIVNGIYEDADFQAVVTWQEKYAEDVLNPWGLTQGTGYIYTTSLAKIKQIHDANCATTGFTTPVTPTPVLQRSEQCIGTNESLIFGMNNSNVVIAQKLLKKLGYFPSDIDTTGYYGPITRDSVISFQEMNGIDHVGWIGPQTRILINELGCLAGV